MCLRDGAKAWLLPGKSGAAQGSPGSPYFANWFLCIACLERLENLESLVVVDSLTIRFNSILVARCEALQFWRGCIKAIFALNTLEIYLKYFEQEMQQSVFAMVAQRTRPSGPARERSTTDTLSTDVTGIGRS